MIRKAVRVFWYTWCAAVNCARNQVVVNYVTIFTAGYDMIVITGYAWLYLEGFVFMTPSVVLQHLSWGQTDELNWTT